MNVSEVTDALILRFLDNMPTIDGVQMTSDDVKFPNAPEPEGLTTNKPWLRLSVLFTEGFNVSPGRNGRVRYEGIMVVDCFVPTGTGNKVINEVQTQVIDLYAKTQFDGIRCKTVVPNILGKSGSDSNWYQNQIVVNFEFDDY